MSERRCRYVGTDRSYRFVASENDRNHSGSIIDHADHTVFFDADHVSVQQHRIAECIDKRCIAGHDRIDHQRNDAVAVDHKGGHEHIEQYITNNGKWLSY